MIVAVTIIICVAIICLAFTICELGNVYMTYKREMKKMELQEQENIQRYLERGVKR